MALRTDLAIEKSDTKKNYQEEIIKRENIVITRHKKEREKYVTIEFESLFHITDYKDLEEEIIKALEFVSGKKYESFLISGLGNTEITADAIGPLTANKILATRHIMGEFAKQNGLESLKSVSVISPGVLGKTGIETAEILRGIKEKTNPEAMIVIDALASGSLSRLYNCIQISNQGISPGSGVKNSRKEISEKTFSVPVIAIGIPTVVDANTLAFEITGETGEKADMILTPKDSDILTDKMSEILSRALNLFLQPETDRDIVLALV